MHTDPQEIRFSDIRDLSLGMIVFTRIKQNHPSHTVYCFLFILTPKKSAFITELFLSLFSVIQNSLHSSQFQDPCSPSPPFNPCLPPLFSLSLSLSHCPSSSLPCPPPQPPGFLSFFAVSAK